MVTRETSDGCVGDDPDSHLRSRKGQLVVTAGHPHLPPSAMGAGLVGVEVLRAQAAALAWVGQATGSYPAPTGVAARLREVAEQLKNPSDHRDPDAVLIQVAATALTEERSSAA